jgi:hypothetical protein
VQQSINSNWTKIRHPRIAARDHCSGAILKQSAFQDELANSWTELIVLARSRTNDPVFILLKENPEKVKEWLGKGRPSA